MLTDIPRYAVEPSLNILKNSGEKVYVNGKWLRTGQENKLGLCGKITLSGCLETIMTVYEFSCWEARLKIVKLKQEVIQFTLKNKSKKNKSSLPRCPFRVLNRNRYAWSPLVIDTAVKSQRDKRLKFHHACGWSKWRRKRKHLEWYTGPCGSKIRKYFSVIPDYKLLLKP